uniref:Uncharacterized protein n=1 Tax=Strigamia maritima TaxID=126957 RepID=T1JNM6_STRMM
MAASTCCKLAHSEKKSRFQVIPVSRENKRAEVAVALKRYNWENLYLFGPVLPRVGVNLFGENKEFAGRYKNHQMPEVKLGNERHSTVNLSNLRVNVEQIFNELNENITSNTQLLYPFTANSFGNEQYLKTKSTELLKKATECDKQIENLPTVSNLYQIELAIRKYINPSKNDIRLPDSMISYWNSMLPFLYSLSDVHVNQEITHPYLHYSGKTDCIAVWQNHLVLIELLLPYNESSIMRNLKDAPLRAAAYAGAVNADSTNSFEIKEILLVIPSADKSLAHVLNIETDKMLAYWNLWLERLKLYWEIRCEMPAANYTNVSYK